MKCVYREIRTRIDVNLWIFILQKVEQNEGLMYRLLSLNEINEQLFSNIMFDLEIGLIFYKLINSKSANIWFSEDFVS